MEAEDPGRLRRANTLPHAAPLCRTRLLNGEGDRRHDCMRYEACLADYARHNTRHRGQAHCPPSCEAFGLVPAEALRAAATVRRGSQYTETSL